VYKDDFRLATPGNCPDVGHSFPHHEADVESKALGNKSPGIILLIDSNMILGPHHLHTALVLAMFFKINLQN
jgi:hypothetical protein